MLLKIWLLLNISLICSLFCNNILQAVWGNPPTHKTKIFDNSSESKFSSGGVHFPYFKHILPSLVKCMWSLDHWGEKEVPKGNTTKLPLFVSSETCWVLLWYREDSLPSFAFPQPWNPAGPRSCPAFGGKSHRAARGHTCPAPKCLGSISPFFGNIYVDGWFHIISGILLAVKTSNDSINLHSYYPGSLGHHNILN